MMTLNRLTLLGLGAGLVVVGCASPVEEAGERIDATTEAISEEPAAQLDEGAAAATDFGPATSPDASASPDEEGQVDSRSDEIIIGGGWGMPWGGFYRGGFVGVPVGGVYGYGVPVGYGAYGVYPGWGGAWGGFPVGYGYGVARGWGWRGGWGCGGLYGGCW